MDEFDSNVDGDVDNVDGDSAENRVFRECTAAAVVYDQDADFGQIESVPLGMGDRE